MWIEIFRGGKQVDSKGTEQDGSELIKKAVKLFNPTHHEPPVVIGHPATNRPAWGWVAELRSEFRDGVEVLMARLKDLQPEFLELLRKKMFKKRSASFHKDGSLRHVGFLGSVAPAVKALADPEFSGAAAFEFSEKIEREGDEMDLEKIKAMFEDPMFEKFMDRQLKLFEIWKEVAEKDQARADQAGGGSEYSEGADSLYDHRAGVPLTMKV